MVINVSVQYKAALRSIILRYAGAPIATRLFFFFFLLFLWRCRFFRLFFVPSPFSFCQSTSNFISFRMVFFYLVTTGWIFYISLSENLDTKNSITAGFSLLPGIILLTMCDYIGEPLRPMVPPKPLIRRFRCVQIFL